LPNGFNPNQVFKGIPLLTLAICTGRLRSQEWLLGQGASPATKSTEGISSLTVAIWHDQVKTLALMAKSPRGLHAGRDQRVKTSDLELKQEEKETKLVAESSPSGARGKLHKRLAAHLVESGWTGPMKLALERQDWGLVQQLIEHGADCLEFWPAWSLQNNTLYSAFRFLGQPDPRMRFEAKADMDDPHPSSYEIVTVVGTNLQLPCPNRGRDPRNEFRSCVENGLALRFLRNREAMLIALQVSALGDVCKAPSDLFKSLSVIIIAYVPQETPEAIQSWRKRVLDIIENDQRR